MHRQQKIQQHAYAIAATLALSAGSVQADVSSAPQSLARGQGAQINVTAEDRDPDRTIPPCLVEVSFVDQDGLVYVERGVPASAQLEVSPGQTRLLTLTPSAAFAGGAGERIPFRAKVNFAAAPERSAVDPCEGAQVSLETFDVRTGQTLVLQMMIDRQSKTLTLLTNIASAIQDALQTLIDNLK